MIMFITQTCNGKVVAMIQFWNTTFFYAAAWVPKWHYDWSLTDHSKIFNHQLITCISCIHTKGLAINSASIIPGVVMDSVVAKEPGEAVAAVFTSLTASSPGAILWTSPSPGREVVDSAIGISICDHASELRSCSMSMLFRDRCVRCLSWKSLLIQLPIMISAHLAAAYCCTIDSILSMVENLTTEYSKSRIW